MKDNDFPALDALPDGFDFGEVRELLLEAVEKLPKLLILIVLSGVFWRFKRGFRFQVTIQFTKGKRSLMVPDHAQVC